MSDEEIERLRKDVQDLQERVHYLEDELGCSVDEERFRRKIDKMLAARSYEIEENGMGYYTAEVEVPPGELRQAIYDVEQMDDISWSVEETDEETVVLNVEQGLQH